MQLQLAVVERVAGLGVGGQQGLEAPDEQEVLDPVGAALAVLLGGAEAVAAIADPGGAQKFIRKQADESDYDAFTDAVRTGRLEAIEGV